MKNLSVISALFLAASLSSGAIAAEQRPRATGSRFQYGYLSASEPY